MIKKTIVKNKRNDDGFSLIELVVAVGILAILSVVGVVAYNGLTKNARKAAVQSAASEVLTGAVAYDTDGSKTPADAGAEWNSTSKKGKDKKAIIEVDVKYSPVCIAVEAKHIEGERSVRSSGTNCPSDINTDEGYFGENPTKTLPTTEIGGGNDNTGNPGDNNGGDSTGNPGGNNGETPGGDSTGNPGDNNGGDNEGGNTNPDNPGGNNSGTPGALTCSHNEELPNWEGKGTYSHYVSFFVYSQNNNGFQNGTTVRAYNEMDGSLVFEETVSDGAGAVMVEYTKVLEDPNRDVFCDFRVEVEHPDGEILTSITRAEDRQLFVQKKGEVQDAAYIYKNIRDIKDVNNDPIEEELPTEYLVHLNLDYSLYTEDVDQKVVLTTPYGSETRDITNTAGKFYDYPGNYFTGSVSFSTHFGSDQEQQYNDYTNLIWDVGNSGDWTLPQEFIAQPSDKVFDGASDVSMYCEVDYSAPEGFVNSENVWENTYNCRMTVDIY